MTKPKWVKGYHKFSGTLYLKIVTDGIPIEGIAILYKREYVPREPYFCSLLPNPDDSIDKLIGNVISAKPELDFEKRNSLPIPFLVLDQRINNKGNLELIGQDPHDDKEQNMIIELNKDIAEDILVDLDNLTLK